MDSELSSLDVPAPPEHPIQTFLIDRGIPQTYLAAAMGVSDSLLCAKFSGRIRFSSDQAIAAFLFLRKFDPDLDMAKLFPPSKSRKAIEAVYKEAVEEQKRRARHPVRRRRGAAVVAVPFERRAPRSVA